MSYSIILGAFLHLSAQMLKSSSKSFLIFSASSLPLLMRCVWSFLLQALSVPQNFPVLCVSKSLLSMSCLINADLWILNFLQTRKKKSKPEQIKFGTYHLCWWRERLAWRGVCVWEPNLLPDSQVSIHSSGKRCPGGTCTAADGVRQDNQIPTHQWLLNC